MVSRDPSSFYVDVAVAGRFSVWFRQWFRTLVTEATMECLMGRRIMGENLVSPSIDLGAAFVNAMMLSSRP